LTADPQTILPCLFTDFPTGTNPLIALPQDYMLKYGYVNVRWVASMLFQQVCRFQPG